MLKENTNPDVEYLNLVDLCFPLVASGNKRDEAINTHGARDLKMENNYTNQEMVNGVRNDIENYKFLLYFVCRGVSEFDQL